MDFLRLLVAATFFTISAVLPFYVVVYVHLFTQSRKYRTPAAQSPADWPTVSVHLPLYNEKHMVKRLIEAVCSLDYPREKLEIVVVDDSTDETSTICEEVVGEKSCKGLTYVISDGRAGRAIKQAHYSTLWRTLRASLSPFLTQTSSHHQTSSRKHYHTSQKPLSGSCRLVGDT